MTPGVLLAALVLHTPAHAAIQSPTKHPTVAATRQIAIDERLAADANLVVGDTVVLSARPGGAPGDTVVIAAITQRGTDPSDVARDEYKVRLHLSELQELSESDDRVDRFAVLTSGGAERDTALDRINAAAFGFRAYRSADVAVATSKTFQVVSRFHRAIAGITVVASAIFLLCILLLRVDQRRHDIAALRLIGVSRRSVVWSVVVEAALISVIGSGLGTIVGWIASLLINWHYRGVYRTALTFALVTPGVVTFAVALAVVLGVTAGCVAALRLVTTPPLALLGR